MNFSTLILLALAACPSVLGWGFLTPTNVVANSRVQLQLTNDDGGGYNWPYEFQIWKNVTGKPDEQVNLQYVTTTPFYWDNNQPAGTFIRFYVIDVNKFNAGSQFILISPDPTESVSSVSMVSTASVASVGATATRITSTTGSQAYPSTPTPTGFYTAISSPLPVKTNVGAIAGGVVGGVLILATLVAGILLFLRRRKPRSISEKVDLDAPIPEIAVTPFEYHPSHSYGGPSQSYGGPSSYAGAGDAPPIYTPPPPSSSSGPSTIMRGLSERKGAYAPVSTVPN